MKSFKPEVTTAGDNGVYTGNDTRFATREEAEGYVRDLEWRWSAVIATRVVESDDPVTAVWSGGKLTFTDR